MNVALWTETLEKENNKLYEIDWYNKFSSSSAIKQN